MYAALAKSSISFRIGVRQWIQESELDSLLALFEKYKGVTDQIALFTAETHPPIPLETVRQRCEILRKRLERIRSKGYGAGVNILATIGHHEENLPNSLAGSWTRMTNIRGHQCKGSFCPNDPRHQEYVHQLYETVTGANPDFIWIDDDVRLLGHLPIKETCFCERCLELFSKEIGEKFTREQLSERFNSQDPAISLKFRRAWLEHNRGTITRLFQLIEKTVHELKPVASMGFMTGERFYEGYDFDNWAKVLSGKGKVPVMWRPGGGFYSDHVPGDLVQKSHEIGRQVSLLGEQVLTIQSEVENFPYQRLRKSGQITSVESASHIAAGCTGTAFNVISMSTGTDVFNAYEPLIKVLHSHRGFYDLMVRNFGRIRPQGIFSGWCKDSYITANLGKEWFADCAFPGTIHCKELHEIGLPAAYSFTEASVTALSGDSVLAFDKQTLIDMLAKAVYMDIGALDNLNKMGLADLTGFTVDKCFSRDCIEEMIEHPLNGTSVGACRDGRLSFSTLLGWPEHVHSISPSNPKAQTLARLIDYSDRETAKCCMGIFENEMGGRICVSGYFPWHLLQSDTKSCQIKSIMNWLTKESFLAYVESYCKMNIWVRRIGEKGLAIAVLNSGMDDIDGAILNVLTSHDPACVHDMDGKKTTVRASLASNGRKRFIMPMIRPWHMQLAIIE
jgi:hypothetical protein